MSSETDTYKTAVNHYLSPKRQDPVKVQWENAFSSNLTQQVVTKLVQDLGLKEISVVDFGCGIGEGLTLLHQILGDLAITKDHIFYTGVDISPQMIATAEEKWADEPNAKFCLQDIREAVPNHPTQLYYSCGVPYSHLTPEEMLGVLINVFKVIKANQTESLILIDVLGRYSIEWITKWQESRWAYCMSFLAESAESQTPMMMTCYYAPELQEMFEQAAALSGCEIASLEFHDRSLMVGRHSTTNEYNPHIPPYRYVVNDLYEPGRKTDLTKLLLNCPLPAAPGPVEAFLRNFPRNGMGWLPLRPNGGGNWMDLNGLISIAIGPTNTA
ncbi:MAG: class I SAM-dependent methyltransferase, partial [Synechococcaceae cyanobacterium RL_1_2]|nr:class I SAM-dependent methyltransferase [Synechococcaceae cyanobacterium RL_1_2]